MTSSTGAVDSFKVVQVQGDSMHPYLQTGDLLQIEWLETEAVIPIVDPTLVQALHRGQIILYDEVDSKRRSAHRWLSKSLVKADGEPRADFNETGEPMKIVGAVIGRVSHVDSKLIVVSHKSTFIKWVHHMQALFSYLNSRGWPLVSGASGWSLKGLGRWLRDYERARLVAERTQHFRVP